jgi:hypothetical protein
MYKVEIAEYLGEGYWAEYPPYEFQKNERPAMEKFIKHQMTGTNTQVRRVLLNEVELPQNQWLTLTPRQLFDSMSKQVG